MGLRSTTSEPHRIGRRRSTAWSSRAQIEEVLEADGETVDLGNSLHPEDHARHERGAIEGVVADREGLPGGAEHDLLVCDRAWDAQRVDPEPGHLSSARHL